MPALSPDCLINICFRMTVIMRDWISQSVPTIKSVYHTVWAPAAQPKYVWGVGLSGRPHSTGPGTVHCPDLIYRRPGREEMLSYQIDRIAPDYAATLQHCWPGTWRQPPSCPPYVALQISVLPANATFSLLDCFSSITDLPWFLFLEERMKPKGSLCICRCSATMWAAGIKWNEMAEGKFMIMRVTSCKLMRTIWLNCWSKCLRTENPGRPNGG